MFHDLINRYHASRSHQQVPCFTISSTGTMLHDFINGYHGSRSIMSCRIVFVHERFMPLLFVNTNIMFYSYTHNVTLHTADTQWYYSYQSLIQKLDSLRVLILFILSSWEIIIFALSHFNLHLIPTEFFPAGGTITLSHLEAPPISTHLADTLNQTHLVDTTETGAVLIFLSLILS